MPQHACGCQRPTHGLNSLHSSFHGVLRSSSGGQVGRATTFIRWAISLAGPLIFLFLFILVLRQAVLEFAVWQIPAGLELLFLLHKPPLHSTASVPLNTWPQIVCFPFTHVFPWFVALPINSVHNLLAYILVVFIGMVLCSGRVSCFLPGPEQCLFLLADNKHVWSEGVNSIFFS